MRFRLRTLLIVLAVAPPLLAALVAILPLLPWSGILVAFLAQEYVWPGLANRGELVGLLIAWGVLAGYLILSRPIAV